MLGEVGVQSGLSQYGPPSAHCALGSSAFNPSNNLPGWILIPTSARVNFSGRFSLIGYRVRNTGLQDTTSTIPTANPLGAPDLPPNRKNSPVLRYWVWWARWKRGEQRAGSELTEEVKQSDKVTPF